VCIFSFTFCIGDLKTKILYRTTANIPWLQSALNFLLNSILSRWFVPKYLKSCTVSDDILSFFMWCLRPAFWCSEKIMYLVLSVTISSTFPLPSGTLTNQPALCNSKVLTPSPRTSRKLPNKKDIFYCEVNSTVWDWSRCFPKWHYRFEPHLTCSAGTVVSWGTQPLGNSSSL